MKRKKVLLLASVASMIDQFNMPNIRLLLRMGLEVHVACNFERGNTCDMRRVCKLKKALDARGVVWHQWDCPRKLWDVRSFVQAYRQLRQLIEKHSYAWMHCHSPIGGALARLVSHQKGIPVLYTAHGFHFYKGAPFHRWLLYYPVEKLLSYWTDGLITLNGEDDKLAKQRLGAGMVWRIPGVGIDVNRFRGMNRENEYSRERQIFRETYQIPQDAVMLLSVGELSRRKNHIQVVRALAGISSQNVYYLVCGQGSSRDKLLRTAKKLGIEKRVRLVGFLEQVQLAYESADIFVFPSLQEGMPAALMEAMAAGLPCVVSDIRGNRELVCKKGGGRFPAAGGAHFPNVRGKQAELILQKCLKELILNPQHRVQCGRFNQQKIKAYDLSIVETYMEQIYKRFDQEAGKKQKNSMCRQREHAPEVSVIMAVYNAKHLKAAVDSIRCQTYQGWELIICDDGSKDGTWEMLQGIAKADKRIRMIRHTKNRKAGAARNSCLKLARGLYIAVMDADDLSSPYRLEKQLRFLKSHPGYAFAGTGGEFFVKNPGDDGERYWFCAVPGAEDFLFSLPYVHASVMFRREALYRVRGYDASFHAVRSEDYDLLLRLCASGCQGANLEEVLYYIRRDKQQYQRRKYRYRFLEAYVKYQGFLRLGMMPKGLVFAIKPLVAGMLPWRLAAVMQKQYYKYKNGNAQKNAEGSRGGYNRDCRTELSDLGTEPSLYGERSKGVRSVSLADLSG